MYVKGQEKWNKCFLLYCVICDLWITVFIYNVWASNSSVSSWISHIFRANTSRRQDLFDSKRTLQINIVVTSETLFMLNIVALFQTNRRKFLSEPDGLNANIEDLHYKFMSATFVIIVTSCLVSLSKHVGICLS